MTTPQLVATIVAVLLAASRLATRFRPFWALLPAWARPWAPAVVVITGTLAGLLSGGVDAESAIFDISVACITAAGLAAPGLPPSDGDGGRPNAPVAVESTLKSATLTAGLALAFIVGMTLLLPACSPSTVQLGADAVRTTCATCRRIRVVCDAVSPDPSGSVAQLLESKDAAVRAALPEENQ